jgi:excisionase family DNA binding protein
MRRAVATPPAIPSKVWKDKVHIMAKKNTSPVEQHYSPDQVAGLLGVTRRTVDNYRARGELVPFVALSGRILFPASTVNKFLESRSIGVAER